MQGYVDQGFTAVKMKVGRLGPVEEEARVAAAREAIGPDTLRMLDANNAWSDLPTALQTIRRFEAYDPYWIEERFSPDDIDNHVRLGLATPITVATGEIEDGALIPHSDPGLGFDFDPEVLDELGTTWHARRGDDG